MLSEESLLIISHRFEAVKNFFQILLNFLKLILKIRRSLERRCYYTSFSTKVNIKFAVFFHKDHALPFVRFAVHPHLVCTKKRTP